MQRRQARRLAMSGGTAWKILTGRIVALFSRRSIRTMPAAMNQAAANRVSLWLRGERALGLTAVRYSMPSTTQPTAEAAGQPAGKSAPANAEPRATPVKKPVDPAAESSRLLSETAIFEAGASIKVSPAAPFASPLLATDEKLQQLNLLNENQVRGCTKCRLCQTRTQTVFGEGSADARIFFIGEGPGENEDLSGRPFVGKAGQLLDKMIGAMGLSREQVYIANIVKCRPPDNRVPAPDEVATCTPYLERQLEIIRPQAIVTLGLPATRYMLQLNLSMGRMRGQFHQWRGIPLMPTYHPAYVLRQYTEQTRAAVWSDLKQVMTALQLPERAPRTE